MIGYLLSQPSVKAKGKRIRGVSPHERFSSVEREVRLHCTGKPDLIAREVTERLVKDRYKMRVEKKQTLEDSMMQCMGDVAYTEPFMHSKILNFKRLVALL